MLFSEVIGQHAAKQRFIRTVNEGRISHAQLFVGPDGCGKLPLALAYAQYVSCTQRTDTDSCGRCPSCVKYQKIIHPDLHFVYPVVRTPKFTKPVSDDFLPIWRQMVVENPYFDFEAWMQAIGTENTQPTIYTHESQEILRKLNLKTFEADYKVMVIWQPETMHVAAANKLLKIIEEPPPKTLFLLVSDNPQDIIGTIRSRSQSVTLDKIDNDSLFDALKQRFTMSDHDLRTIVRLAGGNYNQAIGLMSQSETDVQNFEWFAELMRFAYSAKFVELSEWVDKLTANGRERQKTFLRYALRMVRENFALNAAPDKSDDLVFLMRNEFDFSQKFSPFIHAANTQAIYNEFNLAHYHIERNAYSKIVFLDMSIKLARLLRVPKPN